MSGLGHVDALRHVFLAGAHDFIAKPINPLELIARVNAALRFKREIDRRRLREAQLRALICTVNGAADLPVPEGATGRQARRLAGIIASASAHTADPDALIGTVVRELVSACADAPEADADLARAVAFRLTELPDEPANPGPPIPGLIVRAPQEATP